MKVLGFVMVMFFIAGCTNQAELDQFSDSTSADVQQAESWQMEEIDVPSEFEEVSQRRFIYKNTPKSVVLGGVMPESVPDLAESYIAIHGSVYESTNYASEFSWQEFFAEFYPEVVEFDAESELAGDKDAVLVTKVDGVWLGVERVFIYQDDKVYDLSLHVQREDLSKAKAAFAEFIADYDF